MADRVWIGTTSGDPNVTTNWSPNTVPVNGDRQIFDYRATRDLDTNLAALSAVNGSIVVDHSFTNNIGDGTSYYQTAVTAVDIGQLSSATTTGGSSRIMLDSGAAAVTYTIRRTAASPLNAEANLMPLRVKGSNLTMNISGSSKVGIAQTTGETATVSNLRLTANDDGVPEVELGRGVTLNAATVNAGNVHDISDIAKGGAITLDGGTWDYEGTGTFGAVSVYAESSFNWSGTGNITGVLLVEGGGFDASREARARTIATARFYRGSSVNLDNGAPGSITFTNPIEYPDGIGALSLYQTPPGVKGTLTNI